MKKGVVFVDRHCKKHKDHKKELHEESALQSQMYVKWILFFVVLQYVITVIKNTICILQ